MPVKVTGLCPLLQVFDMPTSVAFYCDKLGFTLIQRSQPGDEHFDWCLLELDGTQIMLNTAYERHERPAEPDPVRVKHHADASIYFGCPDVDTAFDLYRAKGVKLAPPKVLNYGMKEIVVTDPDGYELHFHWQV